MVMKINNDGWDDLRDLLENEKNFVSTIGKLISVAAPMNGVTSSKAAEILRILATTLETKNPFVQYDPDQGGGK